MLKTIGKYEIVAELGQGAMGIVYKARDPLIGRMVALKTITGGLADKPELLERFYQEARSAGALQHPNIVTIFELGKEGGTPYIAMEFIEGESLEKIIARQDPLPLSKKIGYMAQMCIALDYAHKHGVIHRDIKPANIMPTKEGIIKVLDFGIARLKDTSKTQTGMMMGTPAYMSPQLLRGEKADERADIWALGVMLYEMVAYQRPFLGDNPAALMWNIISQQPRPLHEVAPGCPLELDEIVGRMLEKEATLRLQSMEDVLLELDPLYKRLQKDRLGELVAQSQQLILQEDLQSARSRLIEALHLDGSNVEAKTLLDRVNAEIRRGIARTRAKEQLAKAETLFNSGRLEEARSEAESALRLDSKYEEAQQVVARIKDAVDRVKTIQEKVQGAKQRIAEGSLAEADQLLNDVFALDSANEQAQLLRKQIRDENARRDRRKKIAEDMQQARALWSQLRHEECINALAELQREFPGESEVAELLTTVRHDHAEQQKQEQLGEARNLLAAQRYEDAIAALARLQKAYPSDPAVKHLTTLVQQEQVANAKRRRFDDELAVVRTKVSDSQWDEALRRGEQLLKEFPEEYELLELVKFVRGEQLRAEQKRVLAEKVRNVHAFIDGGAFGQAVKAAEKGISEHPGNVDLMILLERAQTQQKEKEKHDFLEKRIREVKARITRAEFTDAIDLARQTIITSGPDTDISQLLHAAEMEMTQREKKKEQDKQVGAARTLVTSGDFAAATRVLDQAMATQIVEAGDPRVQEMLREIKDTQERQKQQAERQKAQEKERAKEEERVKKQEAADKKAEKDRKTATDKKTEADKKEAARQEAAAKETGKKSRKPEPAAPPKEADLGGGGATVILSPNSPASPWPSSGGSGSPGRDYVHAQTATTVGTATTVNMPSQIPVEVGSASATMIASGATAPAIEKPATRPVEHPVEPRPVERPVERRVPLPQPTVEVELRRTKAAEAAAVEAYDAPAKVAPPVWKQPIPLAVGGVVLVAIIGIGVYMSSGSKPQPAAPSQPSATVNSGSPSGQESAQTTSSPSAKSESTAPAAIAPNPTSQTGTPASNGGDASDKLRQRQQGFMDQASKQADAKNYAQALSLLDQALGVKGPLDTQIREMKDGYERSAAAQKSSSPVTTAQTQPPAQAQPSTAPPVAQQQAPPAQAQPQAPTPTPPPTPQPLVASNQPAPAPALQPSSSESRPVVPAGPKASVTVASVLHQDYHGVLNTKTPVPVAYLDNALQLQSYDVPADAAAKGTSVTLLIYVNDQGKVYDGRGLGAPPALAGAILSAAKASWSFTKPTFQGKPVQTSTSVTVKF